MAALPAYSCYDVLTAAVGARVGMKFYDIDPVALVPESRTFAQALRSGVGSIVVGNLFGFPVDWPSVRSECDRAGLVLIEDAAQGLGSAWGGVEAGGFGDLSVLSFGRGKGWSGGGGGALLLRNGARRPEGASIAGPRTGRGMKSAILSAAQWALGRPSLYGLVAALPGTGLGDTRYKKPEGVSEIPGFCAGAALRHAHASLALADVRRQNARRWDTVLDEVGHARGWSRCMPLGGGTSGALRYPFVVAGRREADELVTRLARAGAARSYPMPLPALPPAAPFAHPDGSEWRGARSLADGLVTLPTHGLLSERDLLAVSRA